MKKKHLNLFLIFLYQHNADKGVKPQPRSSLQAFPIPPLMDEVDDIPFHVPETQDLLLRGIPGFRVRRKNV